MRALVACFGNVLRGDDGFGIVVAERLRSQVLPDEVEVMEVGIGGIHLVQELLDPVVDLLVIVDAVDAVDLGRAPGTVVVTVPDVVDVTTLSVHERRDQLADMHYATPERALMLAHGLGLLPASVWLVGCQADEEETIGEGISPDMADAVDTALAEIRSVLVAGGVEW